MIVMKNKKIIELGYIEKGSGKHQSNIVYNQGGVAPTLCAALGTKTWIMILEISDESTKTNRKFKRGHKKV